jgi:hypothetical protein
MPLSAGADQNQTTSRILNQLQYAMTDVAADITTGATGDIVLMLDASDNYEVKYADSANVFELMGITSSAAELNITDGMLATADEVNRVADVSTRVVTLVASGAISLAAHEGKTLLLGEVGGNALCAMTLPAATGSGAKYLFRVSVANTSSYTITTNGADVFNGTVLAHDRDVTDGTLLHAFQAITPTVITLNGGTTGGRIGDWIEIEDILTAVWSVRGVVAVPAGSNPATCFS